MSRVERISTGVAIPPAETTDSDISGAEKTTESYKPLEDETVEVDENTSDGYHTFRELYDHRRALTVALARSIPRLSWRSKQHHPDSDPMFDGYFIVGLSLPSGQVTYHYKLEHWDDFEGVRVLDHAPPYDGHTPAMTIERLISWTPERPRDEEAARLVFQALGTASVAWNESPSGVFDDQLAAQAGCRLLVALGFEVPERYKRGTEATS